MADWILQGRDSGPHILYANLSEPPATLFVERWGIRAIDAALDLLTEPVVVIVANSDPLFGPHTAGVHLLSHPRVAHLFVESKDPS